MSTNLDRTLDNDFVLDVDPQVWGEAYTRGLASYGDNGTNCVLCGKRTGSQKNPRLVLVSHRGTALPPAELPEEDAELPDGIFYNEGGHTLGCFPIGSECAKKIDPKYVIDPA